VEGERLVAFTPGRISFLDDHPYLTAIDGVPVDRWLAATGAIVAHGSPQFRLWSGTRAMRHVGFLRQELNLPARETVQVELASADGERRKTLDLPLSRRKPIYGDWPRKATALLHGNIGYLRIAAMRDDARWLDSLRDWMEKSRETRGLILDVRGNGGGTRDALRVLMPYFMRQSDAPVVVNVAKYRLPASERPENSQGHLENRFLYPATYLGWSQKERAAIEQFSKEFEPEWTPPERDFSRWHYMVIRAEPSTTYYGRPVVVLAPEKRTYPVEGRQTTEAAIHTTFRGDLYAVIGDAVADGGGYVTRIYFNPLVAWMWGGVTIMVARQGVRFIREATAERMASPHQ